MRFSQQAALQCGKTTRALELWVWIPRASDHPGEVTPASLASAFLPGTVVCARERVQIKWTWAKGRASPWLPEEQFLSVEGPCLGGLAGTQGACLPGEVPRGSGLEAREEKGRFFPPEGNPVLNVNLIVIAVADCGARSPRRWVTWRGHEGSHSAGEETDTQNRGAAARGLSWSAAWVPGGHAHSMSEAPLTTTAVC